MELRGSAYNKYLIGVPDSWVQVQSYTSFPAFLINNSVYFGFVLQIRLAEFRGEISLLAKNDQYENRRFVCCCRAVVRPVLRKRPKRR